MAKAHRTHLVDQLAVGAVHCKAHRVAVHVGGDRDTVAGLERAVVLRLGGAVRVVVHVDETALQRHARVQTGQRGGARHVLQLASHHADVVGGVGELLHVDAEGVLAAAEGQRGAGRDPAGRRRLLEDQLLTAERGRTRLCGVKVERTAAHKGAAGRSALLFERVLVADGRQRRGTVGRTGHHTHRLLHGEQTLDQVGRLCVHHPLWRRGG